MEASTAKPRILVVDDDSDYRILVRHHLEASGYEVLESADGANACAMLRHEEVSLVVLDLIMPQVEGLETITRLRRQGCQAKILAVSGVGQAEVYLRMAVWLGANASLEKATPLSDLSAEIERLTAPAGLICAPNIFTAGLR